MTSLGKPELRAQLRARRNSLGEQAQRDNAAAVAQRLGEALPAGAIPIAGYVAMDGELDPQPAMTALRAAGAETLLPKLTAGESTVMTFARWGEATQLVKGRYGTQQPPADAAVLTPALLLLPCVGVDERGTRLGFGGGFYDRYTERYPNALRVGLVHACQLVEQLASDPWDLPLDAALSERGWTWFGSRARALFG